MRRASRPSALWRFRHHVDRRGNSGSGKLFEKEEAASEHHRNGRTKTIALLINVASSSKRASLRSREATNDPAYGADDAIDGERSGEGSGNPG